MIFNYGRRLDIASILTSKYGVYICVKAVDNYEDLEVWTARDKLVGVSYIPFIYREKNGGSLRLLLR